MDVRVGDAMVRCINVSYWVRADDKLYKIIFLLNQFEAVNLNKVGNNLKLENLNQKIDEAYN